MSSTYTPAPVRITPQTLPSDSDGPHIKAADVNTPLEGALDGIQYATEHGADRLDPLANLAALTAIAAPPNNLMRYVLGYGIWCFKSAGADVANGTTVLVADDATPGRWYSDVLLFGSVQSGFANFDTTGALLLLGGPTIWPKFLGGFRSRPRAVSMHDYRVTELNVARARTASFLPFFGDSTLIAADPSPAGGDMACINDGILTFRNAPGGATTQGVSICLDPYMHDGARLASVEAWLVGAGGHGGLTLTQASLGVFRKQALSAGTLQSLRAAGDFLTDAQASVPAYETPHGLTLTTDQNNVVDTAGFTYSAQFWNEFGADSLPGLQLFGLRLTFDNIQDMRFP